MATTVLVHEWVTGGGLAGSELPRSWAVEGAAMRRAIAADFANVPGVSVVMTLDDRWRTELGPWTEIRIGPGKELKALTKLAAKADWTVLIAPETDGILADRTRRVERTGRRLLGSTSRAIVLAGQKLRLSKHWKRNGISTPVTRHFDTMHEHSDDAPRLKVIKPIDGAGSLDTFVVSWPTEVPDGVWEIPEAVAQPYVPGSPMSASFLIDAGGKARLIAVGRQRVALSQGRFSYLGGTLPADEPCDPSLLRKAVEQVPGLRGFVGLDFVRNEEDGAMTFLEINPRPTTSYVGLAQLLPKGMLARSWIAAVEGAPGQEERAAELAELVRTGGRVTFDADGTIHFAREGGQP